MAKRIANGTKTDSEIASCKIFNCGSVIAVEPMRFAGTCSIYSKNAIPQLTNAATSQHLPFNVERCPYQANVINAFEQMRRRIVMKIDIVF